MVELLNLRALRLAKRLEDAGGSETARATTSRTDLWDESALSAARQSAANCSRSNIFSSIIKKFADRAELSASLTILLRLI
jgi:hypothetical protein